MLLEVFQYSLDVDGIDGSLAAVSDALAALVHPPAESRNARGVKFQDEGDESRESSEDASEGSETDDVNQSLHFLVVELWTETFKSLKCSGKEGSAKERLEFLMALLASHASEDLFKDICGALEVGDEQCLSARTLLERFVLPLDIPEPEFCQVCVTLSLSSTSTSEVTSMLDLLTSRGDLGWLANLVSRVYKTSDNDGVRRWMAGDGLGLRLAAEVADANIAQLKGGGWTLLKAAFGTGECHRCTFLQKVGPSGTLKSTP